jgi:alpha-glucoside transport system substrate-binding protein
MEILADPEIGLGPVAEEGSNYISPFKDFDTSLYPNEVQKAAAEVAYASTAFLFDGSDQMPGAVGAGTFWRDMTAWISGQEDLDTALTNIDDSWPAS